MIDASYQSGYKCVARSGIYLGGVKCRLMTKTYLLNAPSQIELILKVSLIKFTHAESEIWSEHLSL
jgi:hypothetical protein